MAEIESVVKLAYWMISEGNRYRLYIFEFIIWQLSPNYS